MISIVGAGPVGSYLGYLLAKKGLEVAIYEEHAKIGVPVQCTGIVSSEVGKLIKPKPSFVVNRIQKTRVYAPNNDFAEVRLKDNLILDRTKFDQHIADMAVKHGAKLYLGHKFLDYQKGKMILEHKGKKKSVKTKYLVGADGPASQVAKSCGLWGQREFFVGIQARAYMKNDNVVEFFPGIGAIAWVVPESKKIVRIGLMARRNPHSLFRRFLMSKLGKDYKKNIIENQGGLIPVYNPKLITQKDNVFLVGVAATMVKPTTGGGIFQGLVGAEALADSILRKRDYQKEWKKRLGIDLRFSLWLRRVMDDFSSEDCNLMIKLTKNKKVIRLLENSERDYAAKLIIRLAFTEPRYLYFLKFLPSAKILG